MKIHEAFHPLEKEDFLYLHFKVYYQPSSKSYYCAVAPTKIAALPTSSGDFVFQYVIENFMNKCQSLTLKTNVSKSKKEAAIEAVEEFEKAFDKWVKWYPNYNLSFKKLLNANEMQEEVLRKISLS